MTNLTTFTETFQDFLNVELTGAINCLNRNEASVYIYCHLSRLGEPSRRILVVTEPTSRKVAVCIEVTYELFEGDVHHYVRQIGLLDRLEVADKLPSLAREAYEVVMAWRPNFADIQNNVFLPS